MITYQAAHNIPKNRAVEPHPTRVHTIAVAGFGAGIPAEMDCKYRYEDGLVYMDEIESVFPQFNWINSQTALKNIKVNGELLIQGSDMPHHVKMVLRIRNGFEK